MTSILLGYEVGTGIPVLMSPKHTMIAGMTGDAGKTTAIEGTASRWLGQKFVVFLAKPGEQAFAKHYRIKPYFKQRAGWQYVEALIQASQQEKIKIIRTTLMKVCQGAKTLDNVLANVKQKMSELEDKNRGGFEYDMLYQTNEYLQQVIKELESHDLGSTLDLQGGINVVDMADFSPVMQAMIVGAIAEEILHNHTNTSIVIPEAWLMIPGDRGSPATAAVEALIRQGRVRGNYVLIDSQDIAGVNTKIRRHIANYLLGKQQDEHEIERTLKAIPLPAKTKPKPEDVMTLKLGQFFAIINERLYKIYARPAWMDTERAIEIAKDHSKLTGNMDKFVSPKQEEASAAEIRTKDDDIVDELAQIQIRQLQTQVNRLTKENVELQEKYKVEYDRAERLLADRSEVDAFRMTLRQFLRLDELVLPSANGNDKGEIATETIDLVIKAERKELKLDESSYLGRIGRLIAEGYFKEQGRSRADIANEIMRRYNIAKGGKVYNAVQEALDELVTVKYGYLRKDGEIYVGTERIIRTVELTASL